MTLELYSEPLERDTQVQSVLVIHNPAAGRGHKRFERTVDALQGLGRSVEVRATTNRGDAETFARAAAVESGIDRVVVAGGDGTINEVIQGLAGSNRPLALIPLGTANVLAHEIGLSLTPEAIAGTIVKGWARSVSLGRIRGEWGGTRYFNMMAGVGVDAHAVAEVDLALKRRIGKGAYFVEALRQLMVFPFLGYRVHVDGTAYDAASAVVAKGHYYAGRYVLAPSARLTEPLFHVCLFGRPGRAAALRYALAIQMGRLTELEDYRIVTGKRVRIEGPLGDPVQADGDIVAQIPLDIDVVPDFLRLVMPVD